MSLPRYEMAPAINAARNPTASDTKNSGNPASVPFWNFNVGSPGPTARFLPDKEGGDLPFVTKHTIKVPFQGSINGAKNTQEPVLVAVTSPTTHGMTCPITEAIRPWWNDNRDMARKYWRNVTTIGNGFIVNPGSMREDKTPANPIRLFHINKSLWEDSIKPALLDASFSWAPWDSVEGRDFIVKKTQKGTWASYASSHFAYNTRALTDAELAAIDTHGLFDLHALLGAPHSPEQIAELAAMFEDSVAGLPFDQAKYPGHRAFLAQQGPGSTTPAAQAVTAEERAAASAKLAGLRGRNSTTTAAAA